MKKKPVKVVLTVLIIVFPIVFVIMFCSLFRRTGDLSNSYYEPHINIENAPEGTAYLDILVKLKPSSNNYVDFAELGMPPKIVTEWSEETYTVQDKDGKEETRTKYEPVWKELNITPDSEIAQFSENGYVSLSVHLKGVKGFYYYAYSNKKVENRLILGEWFAGWDLKKLINHYGKFKAAYVGENGEVLGVTGKSAVRYRHGDPCKFSANGSKLTLTLFGDPAWKPFLFLLSFYGEPVAIVMLIIINRKPKPYLPPRSNRMPRSIEDRNKDDCE
ncbi:MAG: hypothetical protein K2J80_08025 [Oscillospiraceae bacterium]|nr:hypothetical protein [Oscillospiraceae bacterium]